ncbi:MAG TPA: YdeI/OmpD-associated family protein [Propionibacteriaceae bacterium]|nr:YdeI/OmpD-associated family protein [Propionibacteriaceae bacterium]
MAEVPERHPKDGQLILRLPCQRDFEDWLEHQHESVSAVWLMLAKAGNPAPSITYADAVEAALCFGWVDGLARRWDDGWYVQRFTPRRSRSVWSKINVDKAEKLISEGRMRSPGLAAIERAKAAGFWEAAYEGPADIEVPADLQEFLDSHPDAAAFFATLSSQNRYAFLFRLKTAVRPATRQQRLQRFTAMLAAGEKFYP